MAYMSRIQSKYEYELAESESYQEHLLTDFHGDELVHGADYFEIPSTLDYVQSDFIGVDYDELFTYLHDYFSDLPVMHTYHDEIQFLVQEFPNVRLVTYYDYGRLAPIDPKYWEE